MGTSRRVQDGRGAVSPPRHAHGLTLSARASCHSRRSRRLLRLFSDMARRLLSLDTSLCEVRDAAQSIDCSKIYCFLLREDTLICLGEIVSDLSISKDSIGWDLVGLEQTVTTADGQPDSDDEDVESERPALL